MSFKNNTYKNSIVILIDNGYEYSSVECSEFKLKKIAKEDKVKIVLLKLEFLIDRALKHRNEELFYFYSSRYNAIKMKYERILNKY
ncbi:hypothetical protein CPJCM30710_17660 [Clostridium polyendosporum]|uniref:Uncharacterized protein n=1 Tax=Clostridium polyendosporum TaxID=69208 RepID=A0A919VG62_9CLOT|nr:hypothetical protein [Clostridium polyendosporum]GIM29100.1 hypothetical protein CPJCM30710_17660 [Clostridium polyendosporum]